MSINVGEVIAVRGVKITLRISEESNKETLFYKGNRFKGVSIQEHIAVRRGLREIICVVEGEYLDERRFDKDGETIHYVRTVEAKPIGHFDGRVFVEGIKFLPMIKDPAYLLPEDVISGIYSQNTGDGLVVGRTLKEGVAISLPWERLFNTHIGIFGNTAVEVKHSSPTLYAAPSAQTR